MIRLTGTEVLIVIDDDVGGLDACCAVALFVGLHQIVGIWGPGYFAILLFCYSPQSEI